MKKKHLRRNKPNETEKLEKMIRAYRADVAPYRLSYQFSFITNQPILGRHLDVISMDEIPYVEVSEETKAAIMRLHFNDTIESDPESHVLHD